MTRGFTQEPQQFLGRVVVEVREGVEERVVDLFRAAAWYLM